MVMTSQPAWVCKTLVFIFALAAQPALAQIQPKGWPGTAKPAQPGASTKAGAAAPKAAKPRARRMAAVTQAPVTPAADAMLAEVRVVLQQQVALLAQLAAELESQRLVMRDQLSMIRSLEQRSVAATSHAAPATRPAPAPALPNSGITRALTLEIAGEPHRRGRTWFDQTARDGRPAIAYTGELFGVKLEWVSGRNRPVTGAGAYVHPK